MAYAGLIHRVSIEPVVPTIGLGVGVIEEAATKGLDALFDRGVLGIACAFLILLLSGAGLVIRTLYRDAKAKDETILALTERVATIAQANVTANAQNALASAALTTTLDARGAAIEGLSRQIERCDGEVRHGYRDLTGALNGFTDLMKERDRMRNEVRDRA